MVALIKYLSTANPEFFLFYFFKNWVSRAMGNGTFYWDSLILFPYDMHLLLKFDKQMD